MQPLKGGRAPLRTACALAVAAAFSAVGLVCHLRQTDCWMPVSGPGPAGSATPAIPPELEASLLGNHAFFLSESDLRRGVAFRGTGDRLQRVAAKLLAGEPVHVAAVGGSVTWGQGAFGPATAYGGRFFRWLNATWPSPHHQYTIAAKPGVTSALYALCGNDMIPQDVDLVVLEFAFNDYYQGLTLLSPERAAYEQLVRRVLGFPRAPAVLAMHFFAYWYAKPKLRGGQPALFYNTGEDDLAVVAQYYDVPVLSVRNAALHRMYNNEPGFKVNKFSPESVQAPLDRDEYFYSDDHHPYDTTGHRAMADLLVAAMQGAVRDVLRGRELAPGPAPIPEPMFPGNWESANPTCRLGANFKDTVVESRGFEYRAQKPEAQRFEAQKWAWIGKEPGAFAVLQLSTLLAPSGGDGSGSSSSGESQQEPARVILGHVCSWQEYGTATVECVGGCSCEPARMDNHWIHKSTQTNLMTLEVSQHEACLLRVTVDAAAGEKVTPTTILTGVMVDAAGIADRLETGNVGQWDMMSKPYN